MKIVTYILVFILVLQLNLQAQFTLQAGAGYANYQWYNVGTGGAVPIGGATMSSYAANAPGIYFATFDGTDCGSNATEYFVLTANNDTNVVLNTNQNKVTYNWYQGNNPISGATADSLAITSVDTLKYYRVEIMQNGCSKFLPGFHVYHLGIWAPLPIELISFTARLSSDEKKVFLNWKTKSEINTDNFVIERSVNQLNWEYVDQLPAAGNSVTDINYQTVDISPYKGRSYYRLRTTDFDNSTTYSQVESVYIGDKEVQYVRIYPNPFNNRIIIEGPQEEFEVLKIYNAIGEVVRDIPYLESSLSSNKKEIDVHDLAQGVYFISTKNTHTKILKQD